MTEKRCWCELKNATLLNVPVFRVTWALYTLAPEVRSQNTRNKPCLRFD